MSKLEHVYYNMTRGNRYTLEEFKKIGKVIKQIKEDRKNDQTN